MSDSDEDRVQAIIYMTRAQRRRFNVITAQLDTTVSKYILEPALERLERDEAAQRERQQQEDTADG